MSEQYAIVGIAKLKTEGNIAGVLSHMMRTRATPNSDGRENLVLLAPPPLADIMHEINLCPNKRANSVLCYDLLLTASPEFFYDKTPGQVREWAEKSLQWACDKFGKNNIKGAVLHLDECQTGSPHVQILCGCEHEGRLNARFYTGGREALRALWTGYAKAMECYGLKRGREFSPAKHKQIKEFYSDVRRGIELAEGRTFSAEELPPPTMGDHIDPAEYAVKLVNRVVAHYRKQNGNLKSALEATRRELEAMTERTATDRQQRQQLKENPALIKELQEALATESKLMAKERGKYKNLVEAVKEFFRKNIAKNSKLRTPDNLGRLQDFPELADGIKLSLATNGRKPQEMTRARGI